MTNAEKYLKDGVDIKEFAEMIDTAYVKADRYADVCESTIKWLNEPAKPTLTEDERVILRNIDKEYSYIYRNKAGNIELHKGSRLIGTTHIYHSLEPFKHLFQFIKERRRI